jgi:ATP-dependent Lon protease
LSYIATANDEMLVPGPLRDRFRIVRIPMPTAEDLPALCRSLVADLARESGSDPLWAPHLHLNGEELYIAAELWRGGSIRRLRQIVSRILAKRADMARH